MRSNLNDFSLTQRAGNPQMGYAFTQFLNELHRKYWRLGTFCSMTMLSWSSSHSFCGPVKRSNELVWMMLPNLSTSPSAVLLTLLPLIFCGSRSGSSMGLSWQRDFSLGGGFVEKVCVMSHC